MTGYYLLVASRAADNGIDSGGVSYLGVGTFARLGRQWTVQSDTKPWSIVRYDGYDRFEVRPGDHYALDPTDRERAEFTGHTGGNVPFEQFVWVSFAIRVPAESELSPKKDINIAFGQFHQEPDANDDSAPVPFLQLFQGNNFSIVTRSSTQNPLVNPPAPLAVTRYAEANFPRDQWVYFVHKLRFSRTGNGYIQTWRNGVEVVPGTTIPLGYNDVIGPWWKYGIYRVSTHETTIVDFANVEFGTSDLSGRIAHPPPIPSSPPPPKLGDINSDTKVNALDLAILLSRWNTNNAAADLDRNGRIDALDLAILLSRWGS